MIATTEVEVSNPFPGLRPFEADEDYLFFGREQQTDELLRRLRRTRFLAVVGSSGSGKSSLVRAGLVPSLHGGSMAGAGSRWRDAICRPGDKPIHNLAQALHDAVGLGHAQGTREVNLAIIETTLRSSSNGLSAVFEQAQLADEENLLLVVDQFEELFRYRPSSGEHDSEGALAFVKLLLRAAADSTVRVYVVLTMRSDFIGSCAEFPELPHAISDGQFLVPRLSRSELRRAITGPVAVAGGEITSRLVVRLLNEAGDDPDQLPVLQHALMRTWEYWRQHHRGDEPLDFEHYEAIGTMSSALSKHAEEAYAELSSETERNIAEKAFRALVETDESGRAGRRPSTMEQISAIAKQPEKAVQEVIDHFRTPSRGFIVLRPDSFLDLSHESLMRVWYRLAQWAKNEAEAAAFYRRLANAAELHASGAESLWTNPQLALGLQWLSDTSPTPAWAERYAPDLNRALAYLEQSRKADERRRIRRIGVTAMFVVLLIAVFAVYGWVKASDNHALEAANRQLESSNTALQAQVNTESQQQTAFTGEVNALRTTQASLVGDVKHLSEQIGLLATSLTSLHKDSDQLQTQVHDALLNQDSVWESISFSTSLLDLSGKDLLDQSKQLANDVSSLSDLNAQNRSLMTTVVELGIPMPGLVPPGPPPPKVAFPRSMVSEATPDLFHVPPDSYLQALLRKNADLLAQAQQLTNANRALTAQIAELTQQNDKLRAISADLREQVARLQGESNLLSSTNDLRRQQLAGLQTNADKLRKLNSSLQDQRTALGNVASSLTGAGIQVAKDMRLLNAINPQLSRAIQDAQKRK
jgi:cell division protein FtsB